MRPVKVELSSKYVKAAILKENIKKRKQGTSRFYTITPDLPRELIIQNQLMRTTANFAEKAKEDVEQVKGQLSINKLNWKSTKYYEKSSACHHQARGWKSNVKATMYETIDYLHTQNFFLISIYTLKSQNQNICDVIYVRGKTSYSYCYSPEQKEFDMTTGLLFLAQK